VSYHRIDQLHAIVLGGVVTGRDHDTNPLAVEFLGAKACEEADSKNNRVEQISVKKRGVRSATARRNRGEDVDC
jgi:hypothetical protein